MTTPNESPDLEQTIERLKKYSPGNIAPVYSAMQDAIQLLEQQRWIPVSERLPDPGRRVQILWVNRLGKCRVSLGSYAAPYTIEEPAHSEMLDNYPEAFDERSGV